MENTILLAENSNSNFDSRQSSLVDDKKGIKRLNEEEKDELLQSKKKCALIAQKRLRVVATDQNDQIIQNVVWISEKTFEFFFEKEEKKTYYLQIVNKVFCVFIARMGDWTITLPRYEYETLKSSKAFEDSKSILVSSFDSSRPDIYNIKSITFQIKTVCQNPKPLLIDEIFLAKKTDFFFAEEIFNKNRVFYLEIESTIVQFKVKKIKLENEFGCEELFFGRWAENTKVNVEFLEGIVNKANLTVVPILEEKENVIDQYLNKEELYKRLKAVGIFGVEAHLETLLTILMIYSPVNSEKLFKQSFAPIKYLSVSGDLDRGQDLVDFILRELRVDEKKDLFRINLDSPQFLTNKFLSCLSVKNVELWGSASTWLDNCKKEGAIEKKLKVLVLDGFDVDYYIEFYKKIADKIDKIENIFVIFTGSVSLKENGLCYESFLSNIDLGIPNQGACREMLEFFVGKERVPTKEINYKEIAKKIFGFSAKKIKDVVRVACILSMKRSLHLKIENPQEDNSLLLTQQDFEKAIKIVQEKNNASKNLLTNMFI